MKKLLIITSSIDYTVDYIIEKYSNYAEIYRLNVDMLNNYNINVGIKPNISIICDMWNLNYSDIDAIYYRKPMLPNLNDYCLEYRQMIGKDIIALINGIVDSFRKRVLTKPYILRYSENKIFQLIKAQEIGFDIPKSLISNDLNMAQSFLHENKIIKPLTTGKIMKDDMVEIFQTNLIDYIEDDIGVTPIYLQDYCKKLFEVRVTIVDKEVFSVKIDAFDKIDWRKNQEKNKHSIITIPKEIEDKCFILMDELNIKFGAFDFIVDNNEKYIFLEVNPNGQWLWLEEITGLKISNSIIKYLIEGEDIY
ncbi:hypothetical protein [Clostridium sp. ZBS4]|uniref:hypothetical protein n=1 Tax=Clostridium sp. ZBS4 TaxID=2949974 RepID=UPI00207AECDD